LIFSAIRSSLTSGVLLEPYSLSNSLLITLYVAFESPLCWLSSLL
jgi:hypothetical protein